MLSLTGLIVPLITPFSESNSIDIGILHNLIDHVIEAEADGLIVAASTGEGLSLSEPERRKLIESSIRSTSNRAKTLVGCSAYGTSSVIENIKIAASLGADGAMITHPYYSLPDERELLNHYEIVTEKTELPLIIYNNPATTGIDAKPELIAKISTFRNVAAIKESSGDCTRVSTIRMLTNRKIPILCGTDNQALEQLSAGAEGWVAGVANVIPKECVSLMRLIGKGELRGAQIIFDQIFDYLNLAESTGKYVQVNRYGLQKIGIPVGESRLPLLAVNKDLEIQIDAALTKANFTTVTKS